MTRYAAVAIVKDEAATIGPCLASLRLLIAEWFIHDTGSTDGTPDLIRASLDGIPGRLTTAPFVDFGHSRSQAFAEAARHATADWLIATDADMTWEIDPDFAPDPDVDAYMLAMQHGSLAYRLPLLLNARRQWISHGPVHEYTTMVDGQLGRREPTDAVRLIHHGAPGSGDKLLWHASLLRSALELDPSDVRSTYYYAQTLRDLGQTEEARRLYARRASMGGWEEERWHAQYQAALMTEPWPDRLDALLAAWEARPGRAEPLWHAITGLRQMGRQHAADVLVAAIARIPETDDILFVEREMWARLEAVA